jgi:hypothetical protein
LKIANQQVITEWVESISIGTGNIGIEDGPAFVRKNLVTKALCLLNFRLRLGESDA